jgi:hypothetical protein
MTLGEVVAAMHKRRIAGSRSAVWRFFARRNISFKNVWRAPFASDFDTMITEIGGAYPLVRRGPRNQSSSRRSGVPTPSSGGAQDGIVPQVHLARGLPRRCARPPGSDGRSAPDACGARRGSYCPASSSDKPRLNAFAGSHSGVGWKERDKEHYLALLVSHLQH